MTTTLPASSVKPTGRRPRTEPTCPVPTDQRQREADRGRDRKKRQDNKRLSSARRYLEAPVSAPHNPATGGRPYAGHQASPAERRLREREDVACRDHDPELFFPIAHRGPVYQAQVAAAKAICAGCPARALCQEAALELRPTDGIWGGKTAEEIRVATRRVRRQQDGGAA